MRCLVIIIFSFKIKFSLFFPPFLFDLRFGRPKSIWQCMICNKIILIYHDFLICFQLRAGHKEICFRQSARKIILIVSCVAKKRSCAKNRIGLQRVQKNIRELKRQIFQTGSENKLMLLLWIKKRGWERDTTSPGRGSNMPRVVMRFLNSFEQK